MARITDKSKLEAIKSSLIDIIIKDGASNASIAKVAKQANVSAGYLYRHYDSKESLIYGLYTEKFEELYLICIDKISNNNQLNDVILGFYSKFIEKLKQDENSALFLLKMMTDYSIRIPSEMKTKLFEIITLFREKYSSEINKNIENEHLFIQILVNLLTFINIRKRGVLNQNEITKNDIEQLANMTVNALRV